MARWPTCGQNGYITRAIFRVPNTQHGDKIRNGYVAQMWAKWLHHPCGVRGRQRLVRGQKSEMAMWPTCGKKGYITPLVLGLTHAQRGDNNR